MIRPKTTKKYSNEAASDYRVVLGGFSAREKQIPQKNFIVSVSRNATSAPSQKISTTRPSRSHHRSGFIHSLSRAVASLLVVFVAANPFVSVFADELPPDFSDLAGSQTLSEAITSESTIPQETGSVETTDVDESTADPTVSVEAGEQTGSQSPEEESVFDKIIGAVTEIFDPADPEKSTDVPVVSEEEETATTTEEEIIPSEEIATSTEETAVPQEDTATSTDPEIIAGDTETEIITEEQATTTEEEIFLNEEEATTTEETIESTEGTVPVFSWPEEQTPTAQPKVFFKDNECTPTDDGGYYCVASKLGIGASTTEAATSRVYAQAGENDDKEIYYEDVNGKTQITTNEYDDDAPSYDENSSIILWHALINGRYQIMFYDKSPAGIGFRQLTDTEYNNTNPYVSGKSAVWQGWVNDNWEIFYVKDVTAPSLEVRQITTSATNDMFPHLSEKFITWQSFFEDTWHVFVYDMETGETSQITKTADGKYENPRFALLFEKRDENGEVKTIGYDIASGQEIPISHGGNSAPAPLSLPQADNDKALPLTSSTSTLKTVGKDGEGGE